MLALMIDYLSGPVVHEAFFKKYASKKFLKGGSPDHSSSCTHTNMAQHRLSSAAGLRNTCKNTVTLFRTRPNHGSKSAKTNSSQGFSILHLTFRIDILYAHFLSIVTLHNRATVSISQKQRGIGKLTAGVSHLHIGRRNLHVCIFLVPGRR